MPFSKPLNGESRNEECVLENIPVDIMVRISIFLKLSCRIRLASTSKTLQKLIFQDCVPLWREINFKDLPYPKKQSLTDEMLASLLIRVNAKSVTRTINLTRCGGIQGTGLEPLRGSEVLETLDMTEAYQQRIDLDTVLSILRTMIPFKLFHVRLSFRFLRDEPEVFTTFLRDLGDERNKRIENEGLACYACREVVVQKSVQFVYCCWWTFVAMWNLSPPLLSSS